MEGVGIDLGLTTGAIVWIEVEGTHLGKVKSLSTWTGAVMAAHSRSTPDEIALFAQRLILKPCSEVLVRGMTVGIDWSPNDVFWGARMTSVKKAFLMGYIYMGILAMGGKPLILPPDFLRKYVDMPRTCTKDEIQKKYDQILGVGTRSSLWNEHEHDSMILAYVGVMVQRDPRLRVAYEKTKTSGGEPLKSERRAKKRRRRRGIQLRPRRRT